MTNKQNREIVALDLNCGERYIRSAEEQRVNNNHNEQARGAVIRLLPLLNLKTCFSSIVLKTYPTSLPFGEGLDLVNS